MKTATTLEDLIGLTKSDVFDLGEAYEKSISVKKDGSRQGVFHPSAIDYCGRKNVYEYLRYPMLDEPISADLQSIFDYGHKLHELTQGILGSRVVDLLGKRGVKMTFQPEVSMLDAPEQSLVTELGVLGTCDGLITLEAPKWSQRGVVEIKSISDKEYETLTAPKSEHATQAHLYAWSFQAPIIWYLYFNKNSGQRKFFSTLFDKSILDKAIARILSWWECMRNDTLPEREESYIFCGGCEYRQHCTPAVLKKKSNTKITRPELVQLSRKLGRKKNGP